MLISWDRKQRGNSFPVAQLGQATENTFRRIPLTPAHSWAENYSPRGSTEVKHWALEVLPAGQGTKKIPWAKRLAIPFTPSYPPEVAVFLLRGSDCRSGRRIPYLTLWQGLTLKQIPLAAVSDVGFRFRPPGRRYDTYYISWYIPCDKVSYYPTGTMRRKT